MFSASDLEDLATLNLPRTASVAWKLLTTNCTGTVPVPGTYLVLTQYRRYLVHIRMVESIATRACRVLQSVKGLRSRRVYSLSTPALLLARVELYYTGSRRVETYIPSPIPSMHANDIRLPSCTPCEGAYKVVYEGILAGEQLLHLLQV